MACNTFTRLIRDKTYFLNILCRILGDKLQINLIRMGNVYLFFKSRCDHVKQKTAFVDSRFEF